MKKNRLFITLILTLMLCVLPSFNMVHAAAAAECYDDRETIDADTLGAMSRSLSSASSETGIKLGLYFISSAEAVGRASTQAAADYYLENRFGDNSVLLVIAVDAGEWNFSTSGKEAAFMNDAAQVNTWNAMRDYYIAGDYIGMADAYASSVINCKAEYESSGGVHIGRNIIIAVLVGLVVGLIRGAMLKGELKSVAVATTACDSIKQGSFKLTRSGDVFLYKKVDRRKLETASNRVNTTHTSESGQTHGGVGGKI